MKGILRGEEFLEFLMPETPPIGTRAHAVGQEPPSFGAGLAWSPRVGHFSPPTQARGSGPPEAHLMGCGDIQAVYWAQALKHRPRVLV